MQNFTHFCIFKPNKIWFTSTLAKLEFLARPLSDFTHSKMCPLKSYSYTSKWRGVSWCWSHFKDWNLVWNRHGMNTTISMEAVPRCQFQSRKSTSDQQVSTTPPQRGTRFVDFNLDFNLWRRHCGTPLQWIPIMAWHLLLKFFTFIQYFLISLFTAWNLITRKIWI